MHSSEGELGQCAQSVSALSVLVYGLVRGSGVGVMLRSSIYASACCMHQVLVQGKGTCIHASSWCMLVGLRQAWCMLLGIKGSVGLVVDDPSAASTLSPIYTSSKATGLVGKRRCR